MAAAIIAAAALPILHFFSPAHNSTPVPTPAPTPAPAPLTSTESLTAAASWLLANLHALYASPPSLSRLGDIVFPVFAPYYLLLQCLHAVLPPPLDAVPWYVWTVLAVVLIAARLRAQRAALAARPRVAAAASAVVSGVRGGRGVSPLPLRGAASPQGVAAAPWPSAHAAAAPNNSGGSSPMRSGYHSPFQQHHASPGARVSPQQQVLLQQQALLLQQQALLQQQQQQYAQAQSMTPPPPQLQPQLPHPVSPQQQHQAQAEAGSGAAAEAPYPQQPLAQQHNMHNMPLDYPPYGDPAEACYEAQIGAPVFRQVRVKGLCPAGVLDAKLLKTKINAWLRANRELYHEFLALRHPHQLEPVNDEDIVVDGDAFLVTLPFKAAAEQMAKAASAAKASTQLGMNFKCVQKGEYTFTLRVWLMSAARAFSEAVKAGGSQALVALR